MSWPPSDPNRTSQLAAHVPEYPCDLKHAGVTSPVVAYTHLPTVVMPVQKDKAIRLDCAIDVHHWQLLSERALLELGTDRGPLAPLGRRQNYRAIIAIDTGRWNFR